MEILFAMFVLQVCLMLACLFWLNESAALKLKLNASLLRSGSPPAEETLSLRIEREDRPSEDEQAREKAAYRAPVFGCGEDSIPGIPPEGWKDGEATPVARQIFVDRQAFLDAGRRRAEDAGKMAYKFKSSIKSSSVGMNASNTEGGPSANTRAKLLIQRKMLKYALIAAKSRGYALRSIVEAPD